jgi:prepilin-type processing-associated H-X9-DG protein
MLHGQPEQDPASIASTNLSKVHPNGATALYVDGNSELAGDLAEGTGTLTGMGDNYFSSNVGIGILAPFQFKSLWPYGSGPWTENEYGIYYDEGNVGIGTNRPQTKLEVTGDITLSSGDDRTISVYPNTSVPPDPTDGYNLTIEGGRGGFEGNGGNTMLSGGDGGPNGQLGGDVYICGWHTMKTLFLATWVSGR